MSYSPFFRGENAKGSSRSTASGYQNASGGTLAQGTPVYVNSSGQILAVDPSNQAKVLSMVGLLNVDTLDTEDGQVSDAGRLENVVIGYSVGTPLWVSKAGFLTNTSPSIGVNGFLAGDYVIFVGVVAQNEFNPSNKDIKLMITVIGQL